MEKQDSESMSKPPPPYNPTVMPQSPQGGDLLQQQQAYWAQQPVGYNSTMTASAPPPASYGSQQVQVIQVVQPSSNVVVRHASMVIQRIRTGYGAIRVILLIFGIVELAMVCNILDECERSVYYIGLLVLPIATVLHSLGTTFVKRCYENHLPYYEEPARRGQHCCPYCYLGCGESLFAFFYLGQASVIIALFVNFWQKDKGKKLFRLVHGGDNDDDKPITYCDVDEGKAAGAALFAFLLSFTYIFIILSMHCCHCLGRLPSPNSPPILYAQPSQPVQQSGHHQQHNNNNNNVIYVPPPIQTPTEQQPNS